ncbi:MAG: hypothetical protein K8F60_03085 [Melioribacteraceae bacterium]|jgi:hypothetical protein|nr:hypothetical protein [Melioribacteraceae bacterium]
MKKKYLIVLTAVVIAVIVVIAMFFPPADETDTTGTIKKVDKYRNKMTNQEKVVLRNELLQDSLALKNIIVSLQMYENFANTLADNYEEWSKEIKSTNLKNDKMTEQLKSLDELKIFVENNVQKVTDTKVLLLKYYVKDTLDMSIDVDNNLIEFSNFVENFDNKVKAVNDLFTNLDGMISKDNLAKLSLSKQEAEKLKEVREKMLSAIVFHALVRNNNESLNFIFSSFILNFDLLNNQLNNNFVGLFVASQENNLGAHSNAKLENAFAAIFPARENIGTSAGTFNKENLGIVALNKEQLNTLWNMNELKGIEIGASENVNNTVFANKPLGVFFNKENLGIVLQNQQYVFSQNQLGLGAKDNLSSTIGSKDYFGGFFLGLLSKENVGALYFSNESLQAFNNFTNTLNGFYITNRELLGMGW